MTDVWTVASGMMAMIGMLVYALVFGFGFGMAHDSIVNPLRDMGLDCGAGTQWDVSGYCHTIDNLSFACLFLIAPCALIIFVLSVTRRQRRDEYYEPGSIYHQEE